MWLAAKDLLKLNDGEVKESDLVSPIIKNYSVSATELNLKAL